MTEKTPGGSRFLAIHLPFFPMKIYMEFDAPPDPLTNHLSLQTGEFASMADHLLVSSSSKTLEIPKEVDCFEKVRFSLGIDSPENIKSGVRSDIYFL